MKKLEAFIERNPLLALGVTAAALIVGYAFMTKRSDQSTVSAVAELISRNVASAVTDTVGGTINGVVTGVTDKVAPWSQNNVIYADFVNPIVRSIPGTSKDATLGTAIYDWTHDEYGKPTRIGHWLDGLILN